MTGPKPYGLHVISGELTDKDLARIASVTHRFLTFKDAAELQNLKQVYDLPDGGYFIIKDMGGVFRVIADKQVKHEAELVRDGLVKMFIPMFFSGVITRSVLRENQKVALKLTEQCRSRLRKTLGFEVAKTQVLERFTIEAHHSFIEFSNMLSNSSVLKTQYAGQNPGWYSGSMAKLMQFVGGYGRQDFENLPDTPVERVRFDLPEHLSKTLWSKYKSVRLPAYSGLPHSDGAFRFDYKWKKTHAVAFDNQNKPWLIEVSDKVWAMPLPIIPLTADPLFHEYVADKLGDEEILEVLETFGAMPSGECFPENREDFNAWVRAGVIIPVCDVADFHQKSSFYDACGWSFNTRGNNAYNTAYHYDETTGLIYSSTYKLHLALSSSEKYYGLDEVVLGRDLPKQDRETLTRYLSSFIGSINNTSVRGQALLFKLQHVAHSEILNRANQSSTRAETEINYWDMYEAPAIATHSGNVNQVYGGYLFHPAPYKAQPQIKFPNYTLGFCQSFDFTPLQPGWSVRCDTVMFAYYEGDNIKVVKYFYDGARFYKNVDSDYENPMIVGRWYHNSTEGMSTLAGHFYITDMDERAELAPTVTQTTIEGRDAGYDSQPFFSFDNFFWRPGTLWRNRYYTHLTKTTVTSGTYKDVAVVIPMYQRNSSLYAVREGYRSKSYSESLQLYSVQDPYSYRYWTHHPIWAWIGGLEVMKGSPSPKQGDPVWAEMELYNPSQTNDFADNGPWITGLPADYTWLVHPKSNEWRHSGGGGAPKVNTYTTGYSIPPKEDGGRLYWDTTELVTVRSTRPDDKYFLPSPDEYGFTMYRDGCKVFMGQTTYANISEQDEQKALGVRKIFGHTKLVDHQAAYHFIGVIHE